MPAARAVRPVCHRHQTDSRTSALPRRLLCLRPRRFLLFSPLALQLITADNSLQEGRVGDALDVLPAEGQAPQWALNVQRQHKHRHTVRVRGDHKTPAKLPSLTLHSPPTAQKKISCPRFASKTMRICAAQAFLYLHSLASVQRPHVLLPRAIAGCSLPQDVLLCAKGSAFCVPRGPPTRGACCSSRISVESQAQGLSGRNGHGTGFARRVCAMHGRRRGHSACVSPQLVARLQCRVAPKGACK